MQTVTLQPIKAQELTVTLSGVPVMLRIYQRSNGLYADVGVNNQWKALGVICLNGNKLVRYSYLGLPGDLFFVDTKGDVDPVYDGLGDRFKLFYASNEEIRAAS